MSNMHNVRNEIKTASFTEFKDFLDSVRKVSARIGQVALKQVRLLCLENVGMFVYIGGRVSRYGLRRR
jgi:hypothetical protein